LARQKVEQVREKKESISLLLDARSEARDLFILWSWLPVKVALQFLNNVCFTEIAARITRADQITASIRSVKYLFPEERRRLRRTLSVHVHLSKSAAANYAALAA
jgi:hypothetical protein